MNEIQKRWHLDQRTLAVCYLRVPRLAIQSSPGLSETSNLNHRGQLHLPLNSWLRPSLWMNQWCSGGVNSAFYEARHNMLTLWKARVYHVRPVRTAIYNTFTTPSRIVPWNAVHSSSSPPTHANPVFRFGFDPVHGGLVKRRNSYVYAGCFDLSYARVDACKTLFRKLNCVSTVLCFMISKWSMFCKLMIW